MAWDVVLGMLGLGSEPRLGAVLLEDGRKEAPAVVPSRAWFPALSGAVGLCRRAVGSARSVSDTPRLHPKRCHLL